MGNSSSSTPVPNKSNFSNKSNLNGPNVPFESIGPKPNIKIAKNNANNYDKKTIKTTNPQPHKLGQNPANIKDFEEKLKKIHNDEELEKQRTYLEKQIKLEKQRILKLEEKKRDLEKLEKYKPKKTENNIENNIKNNNTNNLHITEPNMPRHNNKKKNNINLNQVDLANQDDSDYDDYDSDDDYIELPVPFQEPIPVYEDKLLGDNQDEFELFKQEIMNDQSLDNNMKQAIINSRRDFIISHEDKFKESAERTNRISMVAILITKLKQDKLSGLNYEQKSHILNQIDKWVDGTIKQIRLEPEQLYLLYEFIEEIDAKLKEIFTSYNPNEYAEYVSMMDAIKAQSIEDEKRRKAKELENKQKQEAKELETKSREKKISQLITKLNKMSIYDNELKELKSQLDIPIEEFTKCNTEYILLNSEIHTKLMNFISKTRFTQDEKEQILSCVNNA